MSKLVYLFELDSVRKTDKEIEIGQQALYDEIVGNGNTVVLTYNQLVDSRGFFSLLDTDTYYDSIVKLFKSGAIRISQYDDVRTISQYLINSLSYDRSFIYSGWPLKSTQKRLLALIRRSLMFSDLSEIYDYLNGVRRDEEIMDLFVEVDGNQTPSDTPLEVKQCKDILENLFHLIKTVLRLSSIHTIYVNPKPDDNYDMSLPKYLHHALCLSPSSNSGLWEEAKSILLSLKKEYEGVRRRKEPIFSFENMKGSIDRSDYHHAIKRLYQQTLDNGRSVDMTPYQYAEAIVDLCYNYQLEYSICNSSKHYNISEFISDSPTDWLTFKSDFFLRLEQTWGIVDRENRYLLDETNVFDEYQVSDKFPDFDRAVRMVEYISMGSDSANSEGVQRYEYGLAKQKLNRRKKLLSSIRRKVLFAVVCFAIALSFEVICEYLQNFIDDAINQWINVNSVIWTTLCIALEVLILLGLTEYVTGKIAKRIPGFLQLSDALREFGILSKDESAAKSMFKSGCKTYANTLTVKSDMREPIYEGIHIDFVKSESIKQYMALQDNQPQLFKKSNAYPIADLTKSNPDKKTILKNLVRLEELFGYHFGVAYRSKFNSMIVDPIVIACPGSQSCPVKPYFPYERVTPTSGVYGTVMIPKFGDKYILIKQYRHAIRSEQYSFPRGYAENGGSPEDNALRELQEELKADRVMKATFLNRVAADSGLTSTQAYVYMVELKEFTPQIGHEGILEIVTLTEQEVDKWIGEGKINDGFTLSAWSMLKNYS